MKCKVQLFKAGTLFEEVVIARDYQDAKKVATARNPGASSCKCHCCLLMGFLNLLFHFLLSLILNPTSVGLCN